MEFSYAWGCGFGNCKTKSMVLRMLRTTYTDPKIFPECFLTSRVNEHVFKDDKVSK